MSRPPATAGSISNTRSFLSTVIVHVALDQPIVLKRSRSRRIVGRSPHRLTLVRKEDAKGYASEKHCHNDRPYHAVISGRNKSVRLFVQKVPVVFVHFLIIPCQEVPK
jgi:hypothetical protein